MFRPRTFGLLLMGVFALASLAGTACGGSVGRGTAVAGRNTPTPAATATSVETRTPAGSPIPTPTATQTTSGGTGSTATPARSGPTPTRTPLAPTPTPRSVLPTATPRPVVVAEPVATVSTDLSLDIFGIGEETTVKGATIIVAGRTRPDAVLSINGVLIPVDSDGRFEVTVALNPGPNFIEVVASDLDGNQKSRVFAVVRLPEDA